VRLVKQTVVYPSRVDVILAKINRGDFFGKDFCVIADKDGFLRYTNAMLLLLGIAGYFGCPILS